MNQYRIVVADDPKETLTDWTAIAAKDVSKFRDEAAAAAGLRRWDTTIEKRRQPKKATTKKSTTTKSKS